MGLFQEKYLTIYLILVVMGGGLFSKISGAEDCLNQRRLHILGILPEEPMQVPGEFDNDGGWRPCPENENLITAGNLGDLLGSGMLNHMDHEPRPRLDLTHRSQANESTCETTGIVTRPQCVPGVTSRFSGSLQMSFEGLRDHWVISIGEGFTGMVSYLREHDVTAFGVDYDQHYRTNRQPLLQENPSFYRWGDATQLSHHSLIRMRQADLVVSHCMLCSMSHSMARQSLVEAVRSLAPGGEARFSYALHRDMTYDEEFLGTLLRDVNADLVSSGVIAEINVFSRILYFDPLDVYGRPMRLIRLRRLRVGENPPQREAVCAPGTALGMNAY